MKRKIALFTSAVVALSVNVCAFAAPALSVEINDKALGFDVPPQIINGRTMVPMRKIFEELGASVVWNAADRTVDAEKNGKNIHMKIDSPNMQIWTGKEKTDIVLDAPASIIDGRTLVPVRAIAEAFDCRVLWDGNTKLVSITTADKAGGEDLTETQKKIYWEAEDLLRHEEKAYSRDVLESVLIDQNGYSYTDVDVVIGRLEAKGAADWNEQAYKAAVQCVSQDAGFFSAEVLRDTLMGNYMFTQDQAQEGIRRMEEYGQIDWNEQAYRAGKFLMTSEDRPYFHDEFKETLMEEFGFPEECADYAIRTLDAKGESNWG